MNNGDGDKNQFFHTSDFYISRVIKSAGLPLKDIQINNFGKATFVFENPKQTAEYLIKKHWNRELKITSLDLVEAINQLKTRLHERL
ncbi:hypothetical protein A2954_04445 [Candidatus Roizmanbacteria bacterium RIFCSPLOWO2_01_FULL_37_12]|uniref:DUF5659 domain-containing protein n=1 Tax=Candidatus Roizmanbacteria bacterium RIFCSPLOWO2_01_FULL_37_12 TaxID=1802056 RepID=A0A1F7IFV2_9BACT|nr:MAG: hypothetical protein A3D76_06355 [Candidatus Roizmanbacteria bacterium RIFCSPHIGHO2_02_FULL_37_9b]OGK42231.1 MAG: hypothetical protein A2954_04445 [Candidatus Roizmanbacteria bacterium RIFCSPLOWO2_01_FULL_37_12]